MLTAHHDPTRLQFRLGGWGWPIHAGVVALTAFALVPSQDGGLLAPWLAAMLAASLALAVFCRLAPPSPAAHRAYVALTALVGLGWGMGPWLAPDGALGFLTTVIGGAALGAVIIQHPRLDACAASLGMSLPLLVGRHVHVGDAQGIAMAAMVALFGACLILLARHMNRALRDNVGLVGQLRDAKEDADQASESKSRFLAQASHDLRQPLHAIGLYVECLKDFSLDTEAEQLIERIDASVENLSSLFSSLLDISMLDVGKVRPRPTDFPLAPMLAGIRDQFADAAAERGTRLTVMNTGLWVRADRALLYRIVQNIVSNAVKYAPGARIVVGCRRSADGTLALEVHDCGPGIAAHDLDRVFEEFTRAADGGEAPPGLGLGLAIVRRLAGIMGLRAELQSWPGRGSVFRLHGLPLRPPMAVPVRAAVPGREDLLCGRAVLLVDDDYDVLGGTGELLSRWGCAVTRAANVADGQAAFAAMERCDLVISDFDLGGPTGLDLLRGLREASPGLPAILMSGIAAGQLPVIGTVGRTLALSKPVRPAQLRSAMMSLLVA